MKMNFGIRDTSVAIQELGLKPAIENSALLLDFGAQAILGILISRELLQVQESVSGFLCLRSRIFENMASALKENEPGTGVPHLLVMPELIKGPGKNCEFHRYVAEFREGTLTATELQQFILNKFLKDDISNILKANFVKHSSSDLKGTLTFKLIQHISLIPKQTPPASCSSSSGPSTMNTASPLSSEANALSQAAQIPKPTPKPKILATCNALFLLPGNDFFPGGAWETPIVHCNCLTNVADLLFAMTDKLPVVSQALLIDAVAMAVPDIVSMLNTFGELDVASGCKNILLMQMRNLFLEQASQQALAFVPATNSTELVNLEPPLIDLSSGPAKAITLPLQANLSKAIPLPPAPKKPKIETATSTAALGATSQSNNQQQLDKKAAVLKNMHVTFGQNMMNVFKGRPEWSDAVESVEMNHKRKGKRTKEIQECCICLNDERDVAFVPCGHTVCCKTCSAQVKHCPICRMYIKNKINLFYS
ncbi:Hypothetical predicted protein [Cloeon dipterum]|uniref:RING-type domain-containing protein n=1 Tax=Cloeon dipterum TaxID=197152 RepID=A0A8S1CCZ8_9INSE|nr:Hypothetical predicted protein [Cloeon dipterum]